MLPGSQNLIITPIAPHNLNVRPVVISDNSVVSFEIEGRADNFLCTLDSRFETITAEHQLAIRKCDFTVKFIELPDTRIEKAIKGLLGTFSTSKTSEI